VLLLRAALRDERNERFLFVSESCVPLHPLPCVSEFLTTAPPMVATWRTTDRMALYDFGAQMDPLVKRRFWRKGHQWLSLGRDEAEAVADPEWYAAFFRAHAASAVAEDFRQQFFRRRKTKGDPDAIHHNFADEHLVQTVLAASGLERRLLPASPTFIRFGHADHWLLLPRRRRRRRRLTARDDLRAAPRHRRPLRPSPSPLQLLIIAPGPARLGRRRSSRRPPLRPRAALGS